jgi:hypothetical protein
MCETGAHHAVAVCAIGTLGERRGFRTVGSELKGSATGCSTCSEALYLQES